MKTDDLISEDEFCSRQHIHLSFIHSLETSGLIEIVTIEEIRFIPYHQLQRLEQLILFYYDLDINIEGIEVVSRLLERISTLQDHIRVLQNRLKLYEE